MARLNRDEIELQMVVRCKRCGEKSVIPITHKNFDVYETDLGRGESRLEVTIDVDCPKCDTQLWTELILDED